MIRRDWCTACGDGENSNAHDLQWCSGEYHPFLSGLDAKCLRCDEEAEDNKQGLCRDCYDAEHGPSFDYPPSGGGVPAFIRQNIIDAGRGHLVR